MPSKSIAEEVTTEVGNWAEDIIDAAVSEIAGWMGQKPLSFREKVAWWSALPDAPDPMNPNQPSKWSIWNQTRPKHRQELVRIHQASTGGEENGPG